MLGSASSWGPVQAGVGRGGNVPGQECPLLGFLLSLACSPLWTLSPHPGLQRFLLMPAGGCITCLR